MIVSFEDFETHDAELIERNKIYKSTLKLPDGIWHSFYEHGYWDKRQEYQTVYGEGGKSVSIPILEIYNQITITNNIKGKYYFPDVDDTTTE